MSGPQRSLPANSVRWSQGSKIPTVTTAVGVSYILGVLCNLDNGSLQALLHTVNKLRPSN